MAWDGFWRLRLRRKPDALKGRQEQSYWFMQKTLAGDALTWGLFYLFVFVLTWRLFFLAGVLTCGAIALRALLPLLPVIVHDTVVPLAFTPEQLPAALPVAVYMSIPVSLFGESRSWE